MTNPKITKTAKHLVTLLVQGRFKELENLSNGARLSAADIARAIKEYRATLIMPDDSVFQSLDVIEIHNSNPRNFSVNIILWSMEEGRSDLTLETHMVESSGELMAVEIDNLHEL
ncbi:MAG: DUF7668 domain-containing protein [Nitrospirota bacterium]